MAQFIRETLPSDARSAEAWIKITDAIRGGGKSVEILARVIDGQDVWELRYWDGMRDDRSNSASASSNKNF